MEYVYAALLLHKLGEEVSEEGIKKVLEATNAKIVESKVKSLVASLKDVDIDAELEKAVVASATVATPIVEGEAKEEAPKEEEKKEESAAGLSSLFG